MVAVRQFDEGVVLEAMMRVFWRQGFEATSIDDLVAASGVKRQSLYNAFGDKEAMFLRALDRYRETVAAPILAALGGDDPHAALQRYIALHIERMAEPGSPTGCLIAGSCTELGGRDDRLGRWAASETKASEQTLLKMLETWQRGGRVAPHRDLRPLAVYLIAFVRGLAALHRATGDLDAVRAATDVGLQALTPWLPAADEAETPGAARECTA
jgi:TetR/AcrR family transcriptional repressor of nem operon